MASFALVQAGPYVVNNGFIRSSLLDHSLQLSATIFRAYFSSRILKIQAFKESQPLALSVQLAGLWRYIVALSTASVTQNTHGPFIWFCRQFDGQTYESSRTTFDEDSYFQSRTFLSTHLPLY